MLAIKTGPPLCVRRFPVIKTFGSDSPRIQKDEEEGTQGFRKTRKKEPKDSERRGKRFPRIRTDEERGRRGIRKDEERGN